MIVHRREHGERRGNAVKHSGGKAASTKSPLPKGDEGVVKNLQKLVRMKMGKRSFHRIMM